MAFIVYFHRLFSMTSTGGGDCNTGQFFGPSGVIAVISQKNPKTVKKDVQGVF